MLTCITLCNYSKEISKKLCNSWFLIVTDKGTDRKCPGNGVSSLQIMLKIKRVKWTHEDNVRQDVDFWRPFINVDDSQYSHIHVLPFTTFHFNAIICIWIFISHLHIQRWNKTKVVKRLLFFSTDESEIVKRKLKSFNDLLMLHAWLKLFSHILHTTGVGLFIKSIC